MSTESVPQASATSPPKSDWRIAVLRYGSAIAVGSWVCAIVGDLSWASIGVGLLAAVLTLSVSSVALLVFLWLLVISVVALGLALVTGPLGLAVPTWVTALSSAIGFLVVVILAHRKKLSFVPEAKLPLALMEFSAIWLAVLFAVFWRWRMPQDGPQSLAQLWSNEDNAGMVNSLVLAVKDGQTAESLDVFGPVSSAIYSCAFELLNVLGALGPTLYAAPQVHVTVTIILLSAAPLAALYVCLALVGGTHLVRHLVALFATTSILVLGSWPFVTVGHTSAIAAVLAAAPGIALLASLGRPRTGSELWLCSGLIYFFVAGSYWFPMVPVCLLGIVLLLSVGSRPDGRRLQHRKWLFLLGVVLALWLVWRALALLTEIGASDLLNPLGATRSVTPDLIVFWLLVAGLVFILNPGRRGESKPGPTGLGRFSWFLAGTLLVMVGTSLVAGRLSGGEPTYSSKKLVLVLVLATLPILSLLLAKAIRRQRLGQYLVLVSLAPAALLFAQSDFGSSIWPSSLFKGATPNAQQVGIAKALEDGADQVFCVPEIDTGNEFYITAYICSRWAASLTGSDGDAALNWRFALLARVPQEELGNVVEEVGEDQQVAVILTPAEGGTPALDEAWWDRWIPDDWTRYPGSS
jgi:hypothetical protein